MKRLKVCLFSPNPLDATSLYRGHGPFGRLERDWEKPDAILEIDSNRAFDWASVISYSLAIFQRPYSRDHLTAIKLFKDRGIPVWIDYDDFLFDVPTDNPTYTLYMDSSVQRSLVEIIRLADVVTVTTRELKRLLQVKVKDGLLAEKVYVVPNALLPELKALQASHDVAREKVRFMWRGSHTHQRDLIEVAGQILSFNERNEKSIEWRFLGYNPFFLTDRMGENTTVIHSVKIDDFFSFLGKVNPNFMVVPLSDSSFNRAKSSIAYVEATLGGAITIAPDYEEWRRPGVITYKSGQLERALEAALKMSPEDRSEYHEMAVDHVWSGPLSMVATNKLREEILLGLVGRRELPPGYEPLEEEEGVMELE